MDILVERYAQGERGALHPITIPWADLIGPNSGLLEACYRDRLGARPIDLGDVVRVPRVGRFVCLSNGWAFVPPDWKPPLDPVTHRPLDDEAEEWILPIGSRVIQPRTDRVDHRVFDVHAFDLPTTRGGGRRGPRGKKP